MSPYPLGNEKLENPARRRDRASLVYDPEHERLRLWYSANSNSGIWRIGYTEGAFPLP